MLNTYNLRELTKKDKVRGLSRNAWVLLMLVGTLLFIIFFLWGILMTLFLAIVLAIMEFFDEDIYDITSTKLNYSFKGFYYA